MCPTAEFKTALITIAWPLTALWAPSALKLNRGPPRPQMDFYPGVECCSCAHLYLWQLCWIMAFDYARCKTGFVQAVGRKVWLCIRKCTIHTFWMGLRSCDYRRLLPSDWCCGSHVLTDRVLMGGSSSATSINTTTTRNFLVRDRTVDLFSFLSSDIPFHMVSLKEDLWNLDSWKPVVISSLDINTITAQEQEKTLITNNSKSRIWQTPRQKRIVPNGLSWTLVSTMANMRRPYKVKPFLFYILSTIPDHW